MWITYDGLRWSALTLAVLIIGCFPSPISAQDLPSPTTAPSCSAPTTTIRVAADATALAKCSTFTGDVRVSADVTGDLALDGLEVLTGSLSVSSIAGLTSISAKSLQNITGFMYLQNLPLLASAEFPELTSIGDQMRLEALPKLSRLGLQSVVSHCPLFTVSGTALRSIQGIDPAGTTNGFNVTNNKKLQVLDMSVTATTGSKKSSIVIGENAPGLIVSLPNLASAQHIDIQNLTKIDLPSLSNAYEVLLRGNLFESISIPLLKSVGNDTEPPFGIMVTDSPELHDINFPALTRVGGITIVNNTQLKALMLERLQDARSGLVLDGNFTT
ncbi:hypothetical protein MPH_08425 [Macrophomina phaseolina MS6]|uniref:Receptor L-domain domain-containing protein n=1 Tax=Macrophomina phaseolina (strain MS6) TaxID=1126212 RepID=K2QX50_MACPH|nr:hypothetical protein MPH_08425 [Macrophomina phaseolina MS6]